MAPVEETRSDAGKDPRSMVMGLYDGNSGRHSRLIGTLRHGACGND